MSHSSWKQGLLFVLFALALGAPIAGQTADSEEEIAERIGEGVPAAGQAKSQACQSCHGADGSSGSAEIPKLAGQYSSYILKQYRKFQFGERKHPGAPTAAISGEDLNDIAAYFASQATSPGLRGAKDAAAENLFLRGDGSRQILPCVSCHGEAGKGAIAGSDANPALGGQHQAYLRKQLQAWRAGERSGSAAMNLTAKPLSDAEIEALSGYLSGLR